MLESSTVRTRARRAVPSRTTRAGGDGARHDGMYKVASGLFQQEFAGVQTHAGAAVVGGRVVELGGGVDELQLVERGGSGIVVDHAGGELEFGGLMLGAGGRVLLLLVEGQLLVEEHLAALLEEDEIGVAAGDDGGCRVGAGGDDTLDVQFVGGLLDADVDTLGVGLEPAFGIGDLVGGEREDLEAAVGVAVGDGHGYGDGEANHSGTRYADAHGVLEDVLAEAQAYARRLGAEEGAGFGHTEGHSARLGAARGGHHFLLEYGFQLFADILFHSVVG